MPDDDERPRDASGAAGPGWSDADQPDVGWANAVAPDDISSLARDIQTYRREQRAARRHARYGRFALGPTAAPLTLTIGVLAIVAIAATLLTVLGPRGSASPTALSLAKTSVAYGTEGGLLPPVTLKSNSGTTVAAQSLRPGVIAVVPTGCTTCGDQVRTAAAQAGTRNINLYAVVPSGQSAEVDALGLNADAILTDTSGTVTADVAPSGLTLLFVNRDGRIYNVEKGTDVNTDTLPALLLRMLESGN